MNWAVIMAGGRGTRFWPASRNQTPKQFLALFGKKTLLEQTASRLGTAVTSDRRIAVTQKDNKSLVQRLLQLPRQQVIGEPVGRNTAPCMILAAFEISRRDPDAVIALLPSDHRIADPVRFRKALKAAFRSARSTGMPVTFGIRPTEPHTGYGYLEMGVEDHRIGEFTIRRLKAFHEKPSKEKAERFLKSGRFLWNSGMFVWRADSLLDAAREHLPEAFLIAREISADRSLKAMNRLFPKMPNVSIDYGLMEKLKGRILTMPADFGWSDVGSWNALAQLLPADSSGNSAPAGTVFIRSSGNFVKSTGKLVALVGIQNAVVVETPDALLICSKSETESIREAVNALEQSGRRSFL